MYLSFHFEQRMPHHFNSLEIVLQVFHRLLKAHAAEARNVVRQALAILTPAVPTRMDDGNVRKILNC